MFPCWRDIYRNSTSGLHEYSRSITKHGENSKNILQPPKMPTRKVSGALIATHEHPTQCEMLSPFNPLAATNRGCLGSCVRGQFFPQGYLRGTISWNGIQPYAYRATPQPLGHPGALQCFYLFFLSTVCFSVFWYLFFTQRIVHFFISCLK